MPQVSYDIPVSDELQEALNGLECEALRIPKPTPLKITLPMGELHALSDISKGIPNDCSMTFNLMLQLAPFLASITCLLRILKLLKPLVDVVTGLTKMPPKPPVQAIQDLASAAIELAPCFAMPAAVIPFAKDIICFIRAVLQCLLTQLKSVRDMMSGLSLRMEAAAGNDDLLATLNCAQQNAQNSVDNLTQAIEPIGAIISLASPVLQMAGMPSISLQTPGASPQDLAGLNALIDTLQGVVDAIDELGICGS
jgi:hypothetical protein